VAQEQYIIVQIKVTLKWNHC